MGEWFEAKLYVVYVRKTLLALSVNLRVCSAFRRAWWSIIVEQQTLNSAFHAHILDNGPETATGGKKWWNMPNHCCWRRLFISAAAAAATSWQCSNQRQSENFRDAQTVLQLNDAVYTCANCNCILNQPYRFSRVWRIWLSVCVGCNLTDEILSQFHSCSTP